MKIKFNSDDNLPLKKTLVFHNIMTVVTSIFHEGNRYYQQVLLDEYLYKLAAKHVNNFAQ